ncbi:MAG: TonB-dependent receptor domain-containing protein [Porticoccaceae bacterium]
MKKLINLNLGLFLVPFFAIPSVNAEEIKNLENIIVTESRIPTIVSESLSSISIFTREDIERYQASDLFELMSRLQSVSTIRNGARGSQTSLFIRGSESDHSLFLVDGVRIGTASAGSATLGLIDTNSIERIEVVRGPKSSLYGADAIGGVVNIITRNAANMDSLQIKSSVGSNGTSETTLSAGTVHGKSSYSAVINTYKTDGIDSTYDTTFLHGDKDGHKNNGIALRYGYEINDDAKLSLSYNSNDTKTDYDAQCTQWFDELDEDGNTIPAPWGGNMQYSIEDDCYIYNDVEITSLSSSLDLNINDYWSSNLQLGLSTDEAEEFSPNADLSLYGLKAFFNTTKTEATWLNVVKLENNSVLSIGLDYLKDELDSLAAFPVDSRDNKAAFLQYRFQSDGSDISFGARTDDNEQFGEHTTISLMAGEKVSDNIRLNFSYGEGFKAPTFNDLYWPGMSNRNLLPEQSKNIELGLKADLNSAFVSLGLFNSQLENLILFDSGAPNNVSKAEITGLELSLETELAGWLVGLSGTLLDPQITSIKNNGNNLARRAERSATLDADYLANNYGFGITIYSQGHTFNDAANTVRFGGYTTLALRANFDLSDNWAVKVNANNLTDKEYVTASGFLGNYRSMGRELLFTLAYTPSF